MQNRIKEFRDLCGLSYAKLAELAGTTAPQIQKLERGERKLTVDWMIRLASALTSAGGRQIDPADLLPPLAQMTGGQSAGGFEEVAAPRVSVRPASLDHGQPRDLPVFGRAVGGEEGWFEFNGETLDLLFRPPTLNAARDAYAVFISGTSMEPRYMEGETIYVNPTRPVRVGDFVVVQVRPKERGQPIRGLVKQLHAKSVGAITLKSLNPPDAKLIQLNADQVISLHRIVLSGDG